MRRRTDWWKWIWIFCKQAWYLSTWKYLLALLLHLHILRLFLFLGDFRWQNHCFCATTLVWSIGCVHFVLLLLFNYVTIVFYLFFQSPSYLYTPFSIPPSHFAYYSFCNAVFFLVYLDQPQYFLCSKELFNDDELVEKCTLGYLVLRIILPSLFEPQCDAAV